MTSEPEARIREAFERGDLRAAATRGLETYGPEVLSFLMATTRDESVAGEVFSQASEDMWAGLAGFGWRSSFRSWFYAIARHAASRHRRAPANQSRRHAPLSEISEVAVRVRTETIPYLRTEVKDRFAQLREALEPDDRALLVLRVNQELSWKEIAVVLEAVDGLDEAALARASARLRQRFQKVKQRIRELAVERGILEG
ncbi:MAG TPA: sigma-70 family RNA polymerase sigma factor [Sandaracinaceae bacterium LLY-WYZ-13_1]|nr:sigma-70 family RNA polymerase sigma factor [Sandaracinaceae bacterium LLY-WYZ-13_1]